MVDFDKLIVTLEELLPAIAKKVILNNNNLTEKYRNEFLEHPDAVNQHDPNWHQWGIISHSIKARKIYDSQLFHHINKWGLEQKVKNYLQQEIGQIPKANLFRLCFPLHDIGKFNKSLNDKTATWKFNFSNHPQYSQEIILNSSIKSTLEEYGLNEEQIIYVSACAGKHYGLGKIRSKIVKLKSEYSEDFIDSNDFPILLAKHLPEFKGLEAEVGLFYLVDSLAKTDIIIPSHKLVNKDEYIADIKENLARRKLNPNLINAIQENPVNMHLCKKYLNIVFDIL